MAKMLLCFNAFQYQKPLEIKSHTTNVGDFLNIWQLGKLKR